MSDILFAVADLLRKAVDTYFEDGELHQLVDIACICGMQWCRKE